jgi:hypothetical protein
MDGAVSHSFIELYNPSDSPVDLNGFSLQAANGPTAKNAVIDDSWNVLDLNGKTIGSKSSLLIVSELYVNASSAKYTIPDWDISWDIEISNRAFSVALVSGTAALSKTVTPGEWANVHSFVSGLNTPGDDAVNNTRGTPVRISKQVAARRVDFSDTGDNAVDFEGVRYSELSAEAIERLKPRFSGDGSWETVLPPAGVELAFSHEAGLYEKGFDLELSAGEGTIYYTTDGSDPTPETAVQYTGAIKVSNRTNEPNVLANIQNIDRDDYYAGAGQGNGTFEQQHPYKPPAENIFKGNVIKARVFDSGGNALTGIVTKSYIINPPSSFGDLPVISVAVNAPDFFDPETGIYVWTKDGHGQEVRNWNNRGAEWERACHLELFEPDGTVGISQYMGVRMHGGVSRNKAQKTMRFYASESRDPGSPSVDYDLFDGAALTMDGAPIETFQHFLLRNFGNDSAWSNMRDMLVHKFSQGLNFPVQDSRYAVVLLNGEFWGLYEIRERIDEYFVQSKYGLGDTNTAIMSNRGYGDDGEADFPADFSLYNEMFAWFENNPNLSSDKLYKQAQRFVDIDNLIDYFIVETYVHNHDWPENNVEMWRYRTGAYPAAGTPLSPEDGRWRYILKDTDFGFGLYEDNAHGENELARMLNGTEWGSLLFRRLCTNREFVTAFVNRYCDLMNTHMETGYVKGLAAGFAEQIEALVPMYLSRWYQSWPDYSWWVSHVNKINTFSDSRAESVRGHMLTQFAFVLNGASEVRVTLTANAGEGTLGINGLTLQPGETPGVSDPENWSGTYFTGTEQIIAAVPDRGYRFEGFVVNGETVTDNPLTLSITGDMTVEAVFAEAPVSPVIIHQVYGGGNPADGSVSHSFIELYNASGKTVELGGYSLQIANSAGTGEITGDWEVLPLTGKSIKPESYFLVVLTRSVSGGTPRYTIANWDMEWDTALSNRAYSVALVSGHTKLSETITPAEKPKVLDLVGAVNDPAAADRVHNCEGSGPVEGATKQKTVRRIGFQDTDDNAADFEVLDYRESGITAEELAEARPRWSGSVPQWENIFTDIAPTDWFYDAVAYANYYGYVDGSDNLYMPLDNLSRAEFVTLVWKLEQQPVQTGTNPFTDVPDGMWYTGAVIWAAGNGIVNGDGSGSYNPGKLLSRQEMITMLYNYLTFKKYGVPVNRKTEYEDSASVASWAAEAVEKLSGAGVLNRFTGETLNPAQNANRAELAQIFMDFLRLVAGAWLIPKVNATADSSSVKHENPRRNAY